MTAIARMRSVVLDCPDPVELAGFYRRLLGGEITSVEHGWVVLEYEPGRRLAFQRDDAYVAPTWPGHERPQQLHLDVTVDDIDVAEASVLAIGATKHEVQPGAVEGEPFRVYLDPVGHPFCLCWD